MSILIKHGGQTLSTRAGRAWHLGLMICLPHESRPRIGCPGKSACKAPGDWLRHFLSDYLCAAPGAGAIPGSEQAGALGPAPLAIAAAAPALRSPGQRHALPSSGKRPQTACLSKCAPACRYWRHLGVLNPKEAEFAQVARAVLLFARKAKFALLVLCRPQRESKTYRKCTCTAGTEINNSEFREGFSCSRI